MKNLFGYLAVPIFLFMGFSWGNDLTITEVFFDGTDEWVELTNMSDQYIQESIALEGAKSSSIDIDIDLGPGETAIYGDKGDDIIVTGLHTYRDLGLSMTDTQGLDIIIKRGQTVIDRFTVSTGAVDDTNNQKASFEYIPDIEAIMMTVANRSSGMIANYTANPGYVSLSDGTKWKIQSGSGDFGSGDTQSGSTDTGTGSVGSGSDSITGVNHTGSVDTSTGGNTTTGADSDFGDDDIADEDPMTHHQLLLTEVYVDGTAEWFEITNVGTGAFSGSLEVEGAKSSTISIDNIVIPASTSMVRSDKTDNFIDASIVAQYDMGLSILDTQELYMTIKSDGRQIDRFGVTKEDVERFDNQKRSFEKVLMSGERITTATSIERKNNVHDPLIGNPGQISVVDQVTEQLFFEQLIRTCPEDDTILQITEISNGVNGLPTYIEIQGLYTGAITLSGSILHHPLIVSLNHDEQDDYSLIATSSSGFVEDTAVLTGDIQLLSGGQLVIYGQSGQVLDNVYMQSSETLKSYYPSGTRQNCIMSFVDGEQPTPGLSKDILGYFQFKDQETPSSTAGSCAPRPEFVDISIRGIIADPEDGEDESIVLHMNRGPDTKYLNGYYLMIGERKRYLDGKLELGQTKNIYQNFGFPNTRGECITLYDPNGELLDDICYTLEQTEGLFLDMSLLPEKEEAIADTQDLEPDISIVDIIYNPVGNDSSNEVIHVQNKNDRRYNEKELRLQVGDRSSKTYIYDTLWSNEEKELFGNFRLPNTKAICVSLLHKKMILDTYCYDPDEDRKKGLKKSKSARVGGKNSLNNIQIAMTGVVYDPDGRDTNNESITFVLKKGTKVDLSSFHLLVGKNKRTLAGVLTDDEPLTITKTFGLHNSRMTCITLLHEERVYDQYCYDPNQTQQQQINDDLFDTKLSIENIIYNPEGRDSDGETITIHNHSDADIEGALLRLNINKREVYLTGKLSAGEAIDVVDHFRFPNDGACVSLMYADYIYDTRCYGDQSKQTMNSDGKISIMHIDYDPPGSDTKRESIALLLSGTSDMSLENAYILINDRKKTLKGSLTPQLQTSFTDSYRFPNDGACVELYIDDKKHDQHCYGEHNQSTGQNQVMSIIVQSVLPNPRGNDTDRERIQILAEDPVDTQTLELYVNDQKQATSRTMVSSGVYEAVGSLGLTNKVGCISLHHQQKPIDSRCYRTPGVGIRAYRNQHTLSLASSEQARMLNQITLADERDRYCLKRDGELFDCKEKTTKTSTHRLDRFYKSYISSMHDYLYHNRPTLYFKSDIALYRDRYKQAEDQLSDGSTTIAVEGKTYTSPSFSQIAKEQTPDSYYERIISQL